MKAVAAMRRLSLCTLNSPTELSYGPPNCYFLHIDFLFNASQLRLIPIACLKGGRIPDPLSLT
jgi:hypothetical protein